MAAALDLTLRSAACNARRRDARAMERYGRAGVGVPEGAIDAIVAEIAGDDMRDFFARFVHGTDDPPLAELLDSFGVDFHVRAAVNAADRGGKPSTAPPPTCRPAPKSRRT